jgi:hypothetical protein
VSYLCVVSDVCLWICADNAPFVVAYAPSLAMASLDHVKAAIDAVAQKRGFRCVPVSWEDATRGHTGFGGLSTMGPNISDVRLFERSGRLLYTCRSQNWNERLGYVAARDVAMVIGNEHPSASVQTSTTLRDYLQSIGTHAKYAGLQVPSLFEPTLDEIFSIRFQTVFLPVGGDPDDAVAFGAKPPTTEFCTEVFNYQTSDASDPKNLLLLATPQGTSVQQDGRGPEKIFFHSVDSDGVVHRFWLEAEKSEKQVGGAQVETMEEVAAAAARGKATAVRIGPASMGTRFNVQMLIQVPLKQRPRPATASGRGRGGGGRGGTFGFVCADMAQCAMPSAAPSATACWSKSSAPATATKYRRAEAVGVSNAARVSRGTEHDIFRGVASGRPERDPTQHGTITVTMYYTVVGGVPSAADVERAVADLDDLYKACPSDKRLAQCHEVTAHTTTWQAKGGIVPPPPPPPKFGVQQPPTVSAPVASSAPVAPVPCTCCSGHPLAAMYGAEPHEPTHGWWCDGCGVFMAHGRVQGATLPKGYGCRKCDFDLCANCAFMPTCRAHHPLVRVPQAALAGQDTITCHGCRRPFATHVAVMRGCVQGGPCQMVICQRCFTAETIKCRM